MKNKLFYILISFIISGCSGNTDQSSKSNVSFVKEEAFIKEESDVVVQEDRILENIIKSKIQQAIDLNELLNDTTLPEEMREEILANAEKLEGIKYINGKLSDVIITNKDSNRVEVDFLVDSVEKKAFVKVEKNEKIIQGEQIKTLDVEVLKIK